MISQEGSKVETDTSRMMDQSTMDAAWNDDSEEAVTETPVAEIVPTEAVAESPAPVETSTEAPAPVAEEAQPITREDGATWSEKAKRWYLDGKIVAGDAPAAETPAAVAPSNPSTPQAAPTEAAKPVEPSPYWVRHAGQKTTIPHTLRNADGSLVVSPEGVPIVSELFTQALAHRQSWPQQKAEYEQRLQLAEQTAAAKSGKYNRAAITLADAVLGSPEADPSLLTAILRDLPPEVHDRVVSTCQRESGYIRRDVDHVLKAADLEIPKAPAPQEMDPAQVIAAVRHSTSEETESLLDELGRDLTPEQRKDISDAMLTHFKTFWDEREELGGELGLDRHALKAAIEREVKVFARIREAALQAERVAAERAKATAFNSRQNTPPPTPAKPAKPRVTATVSADHKGPTFEQAWEIEDD